jgi:hypothetical protein
MESSSDNPQTPLPLPRKYRPRWFQYRLRTLFLVTTALCVWLGWESHVVRERKAAIDEIRNAGGILLSVTEMRELTAAFSTYKPSKGFSIRSVTWETSATIPFIRKWLGDEAIASIMLPGKASDEEVRRITTLFPEAHVGKPQYSSPMDDPRSMTR